MSMAVKIVAVTASVASLVGGVVSGAQMPPDPRPDVVTQAHVTASRAPSAGAAVMGKAAVAHRRSGRMCVWLTADGVNIRSAPSASAAVLGLAYYGDALQVWDYDGGEWQEGTDLRTGVHGWVAVRFLNLSFSEC
jgi:hypothetical protein